MRYKKPASKLPVPKTPKTFQKAVTAIAKKTIMRTTEHKYAVVTQTQTFGTNGFLTSLYGNVVQGDGQQNRDGDQIRSTGVTIRGRLSIEPTVITSNQDFATVRMLVVSGKRPLTSGDMPGFRDPIDYERLNVHVDKYINFSTTKRCVWMRRYIKFQRVIPFEGFSPNKNELYVWFIPIGGSSPTTTTGFTSEVTYHIGFKDL